MRTLGIGAVGLLVLGAIAQGAYSVKLQREVGALSQQLQAMREGTQSGAAGTPSALALRLAVATSGAVKLPAGAAGAIAPAPLPAVLASEEAREQLRGFVAGEIERQAQQKKEQKILKRSDGDSEFRDKLVREMSLPDADAKKVTEILARSQQSRRELRDAEKAGTMPRAEVATAFASLKETTVQGLKEVLGDGWVKKLEDAQPKVRDSLRQQQAMLGGGGQLWFMPRKRED